MKDAWREAGATLGVGALVATTCLLIAGLNPAFFWHDDCQIGAVPMMVEIHRALANGEWPLVTDTTWCLAAIAGEYQPGVFSVLTLPALAGAGLLGALGASMPTMAAAFGTFMLTVAATGAFRVARGEGLGREYATLVAIAGALNGWNMAWGASNWVPAIVGFAATTWAWWAIAAAIRPGAGLGRLLAAAFAVYVLMSCGWPHTIFMTALITAWLLVREGWDRRAEGLGGLVRPAGTAVAAWLLGIGLAAPGWLMFVDFVGHTARSDVGSELQWKWLVPLEALPGLVVPTWVSLWDGYAHAAVELANGLVPTAALVAVLAACDRRFVRPGGWALLLAGLGLALASLPSIGMFRWSFRWLPLFHIALALAAAHWLAARHAGAVPAAPGWSTAPALARFPAVARWAGNPGAWAVLAVVVIGLWSRQVPVFSPALPLAYLGLALLWAWIEANHPLRHPNVRWAPAGVALATLVATYTLVPNGLSVPFWRIDEDIRKVEPLRPDVRYLALSSGGDYFADGIKQPGWGAMIRPGNTAMLAGVHFVNGYSALQMRGLTRTYMIEIHGYTNSRLIDAMVATGVAPGGLLARVGVDGLVLGDSARGFAPRVAAHGWTVSATTAEGVLLHRNGPASPAVRTVPGIRAADMADSDAWHGALAAGDHLPVVAATPERPAGTKTSYVERPVHRTWAGRNAEAFAIAPGAGPAMVAITRVWLPGYEAIAPDGRALPMTTLDGTIIGVEVPADVAGEVVVRYRPAAMIRGFWIAGGTALVMLGILVVRLRRRPPLPSGERSEP